MLDFNTSPYYDDFDQNKHFHKILFRPGRAIQARELNQSQTILQDQVSRFANHVFSQNTPISGGTLSHNSSSVKLELYHSDNSDVIEYTNLDVTKHLNKFITNSEGTLIAKIIAVSDVIFGEDEITIESYPSVIIDEVVENDDVDFIKDEYIYDYETKEIIGKIKAVGTSHSIHISDGIFYIVYGYNYSKTPNPDGTYPRYTLGYFVKVDSQVISINSANPTCKIGLGIYEKIIDHIDDNSLLEPALGTSNFQSPGADRYVINLALEYRPITDKEYDFIELLRLEKGNVIKKYDETVYGQIDDYFAKRTYEVNGNFVVQEFELSTTKEFDNDKFQIRIGSGNAYVGGYRINNKYPIKMFVDKALETESESTSENISYGNSFKLDLLKTNTISPYELIGKSVDVMSSTSSTSSKLATCDVKMLHREGSDYRLYVHNINLTDKNSNLKSGSALKYDNRVVYINDFIEDDDNEDKLLYDLRIGESDHIKEIDSTKTVGYSIYNSMFQNVATSGELTFTFATNDIRNSAFGDKQSLILISNYNILALGDLKVTKASTTGIKFTSSDLKPGAYTLLYKSTENKLASDLILKKSLISYNSSVSVTSIKDTSKADHTFYPDNGILVFEKGFDFTSKLDITLPISDVTSVKSLIICQRSTSLANALELSNSLPNFKIDYGQGTHLVDYTKLTLKDLDKIQNTLRKENKVIVCFNYLKKSDTSKRGFYCANSYEGIEYNNIPSFSYNKTSTSLKHLLDLRSYRENLTGVIKNQSLDIIPGTDFSYTKSYYLPRKDILILTKDGEFTTIPGDPSTNPVAPKNTYEDSECIELAEIEIDAFTLNPFKDVNITPKKNHRYTMRQIVNNIEHFDKVLNNLKLETKRVSNSSGASLDIYGTWIEDFSSYENGDFDDVGFSSMININNKSLKPISDVTRFKLKTTSTDITANTLGSDVANTKIYSMTQTPSSTFLIDTLTGTSPNFVKILPTNVKLPERFVEIYPAMDSFFDMDVEPIVPSKFEIFGKIFRKNSTLESGEINSLRFVDWKNLIGVKVGDEYFKHKNIPTKIPKQILSVKGYGFPPNMTNASIKVDGVTIVNGGVTSDKDGNIVKDVKIDAGDFNTGKHEITISGKQGSGSGTFFATSLIDHEKWKTKSSSVGGSYDEYSEKDSIYKPMAQTFSVANDVFLKEITLYVKVARDKLTIPINISICESESNEPNGRIIDFSSKTAVVSGYTAGNETEVKFTFDVPVFLAKGNDYAILIKSSSSEVEVAVCSDDANKDTQLGYFYDPSNGSNRTGTRDKFLKLKILSAKFSTGTKVISFELIPPDSNDHSTNCICGSTTDLTPGKSNLTYKIDDRSINMGKFGTPSFDDVYFKTAKNLKNAKIDITFTNPEDHISPILSSDGLNIFKVLHVINNLELYNDNFSKKDASYLGNVSSIKFVHAEGDSGGEASGKIENGVISITNPGSGYIKPPIIQDDNDIDYTDKFNFNGELVSNQGNAKCRYISKIISLNDIDQTNNLTVFVKCYRPTNSNLHVFYRAVGNQQDITDANWNLMSNTNKTKFCKFGEVGEYEFRIDKNGNVGFNFKYYQIKVVLTTSDMSVIPSINSIMSNVHTSYTPGNSIAVKLANGNTSAVTLNVE